MIGHERSGTKKNSTTCWSHRLKMWAKWKRECWKPAATICPSPRCRRSSAWGRIRRAIRPFSWHRSGAAYITLPTVTVAVKRLEKKGYVVKRRDEYDGRVQRVELTPRGRKMDAAHKYFHQNMVRSITRSMSETEVEQLVQALGKLNDFFERKQEELYQKKKGRNE